MADRYKGNSSKTCKFKSTLKLFLELFMFSLWLMYYGRSIICLHFDFALLFQFRINACRKYVLFIRNLVNIITVSKYENFKSVQFFSGNWSLHNANWVRIFITPNHYVSELYVGLLIQSATYCYIYSFSLEFNVTSKPGSFCDWPSSLNDGERLQGYTWVEHRLSVS